MGNLASVKNGFRAIGKEVEIVSKPELLQNYDKLILPGVGPYGDAMEHLKNFDLEDAIKDYAKTGRYMMGICLGMQLLFDSSNEFGEHNGLGLLDGKVEAFDKSKFNDALKVPHMGWNQINIQNNQSIFKNMDKIFYLYFVHSFHIHTQDKYILGNTDYGYNFASAVQKDNIIGIQPHPEKSHDNGLKILKNFIDL